ncbi:hypothetical protein BAE44_0013106 [Dichanthelium oligosanthes]|uniref:Uncharacterized protein n=1 Tax=Dichanthelium oligosanthes TaxID=888268 RepID=A0A1E5VLE6_9POAL|nr:hypothetical protein BAE44_0013106 [Dichanthelium oligosanthes]
MPHLRSRDKAGAAAAASPPSPPAAAAGTPAPSPSTSLRLGIGPASPDDDSGGGSFDLKSPAAAPPRRSLRLAGAAAPSPTAPGSSGTGSGPGSGGSVNRTGRARDRVSASSPAATSPRDGNSGSDGGGSAAARASAGGGAVPFMSLRSGSRIAKRRMEDGALVDGEAGPGSSSGGQVRDEMLHRGVGMPTKRWKSILFGGMETEYVADSESDSDEDCVILGPDGVRMSVAQVFSGPSGVEASAVDLESDSDEDCVMLGPDGVRMPAAQVPSGQSGVELNAVTMDMDRTEEGARDDPAMAGNGESLRTQNLLWTAVCGGVVEELAPAGSPSSPETEIFADIDEAVSLYLKESGGCLTDLMLNNVEKVGDLTALAISGKCSVRLEALDLSFCRELTNEALGLIVDSCPSLRILKLFGCTQITDFFLNGHSNTLVKIVGIEGSILAQMDNR